MEATRILLYPLQLMNTSILNKCVEELSKEDPRLDYIRGMLETLIEMAGNSKVEQRTYAPQVVGSTPTQPTLTDDASVLDAKARAAIDIVKRLSAQSQQ